MKSRRDVILSLLRFFVYFSYCWASLLPSSIFFHSFYICYSSFFKRTFVFGPATSTDLVFYVHINFNTVFMKVRMTSVNLGQMLILSLRQWLIITTRFLEYFPWVLLISEGARMRVQFESRNKTRTGSVNIITLPRWNVHCASSSFSQNKCEICTWSW